jgi:uncharacterized protein
MPQRRLSRRAFLKISLVTTAGIAVGGMSSFAYAGNIEPNLIEVKTVNLTLPRLSPAFDGYKIAQISDIHMGTGMTQERLERIVEMINSQQPDSIAVTGDFVTHGDISGHIPALTEPLSKLTPKDVAVAVLGNHDHWTSPVLIQQVIRDSGMVELSNNIFTIQRGSESLHFGGVDSYWEHLARVDDVVAKLPADGATILLAHEPDFADISAQTGRFDLQISGHSHGGQIILPFFGPPVVPRLGRKYPIGQYQVGGMIQYTNRGVGTILPAIRFNCRPEITIFTLTSSASR